MSHRAHGKGDRLRYQLGLVLWLLSTGVCKCHLGIAQHRIPGGEMVEPREYMYRFVQSISEWLAKMANDRMTKWCDVTISLTACHYVTPIVQYCHLP